MTQIELITSVEDLNGTWYFEFYRGEFRGDHWNSDSVYLDADLFDFVERVFHTQMPEFAKYGPTTISGRRIEKLAKALDEFAAAVNRAETPDAIWRPNKGLFIEDLSEKLDDWTTAKRQLSTMLRDLSRWLRGIAARSEPVTILGI
jgi:hypothetical protein